MKKYYLEILFFVILSIEIFFDELDFKNGVYALKPLLMPILGIIFWKNKIEIKGKDYFLALGLFFAWLGDCILMYSNPTYFIFGLGAFLITHVLYIYIFYNQKNKVQLQTFLVIIVPILYFLFIYSKIPKPIVLPVIAYFLVIVSMAVVASMADLRTKAYKLIFAGAVLFVVSDSILAYNKFVSPVVLSSFWIMATYGLAQYLIVRGFAVKR